MFALGNATFACSVHSTRERSFEEASGETEVGRCLLPLPPEPRPLPQWTNSPVHKTNPNLNQQPSLALFCLQVDNSCCYACYSCGNNCNVVVKLVQECKFFFTHFTSVLRKQFAANDMFLREANSYKRVLTLRNLRLQKVKSKHRHTKKHTGPMLMSCAFDWCLVEG